MKKQDLDLGQILAKISNHEIFIAQPNVSFVLLGGSLVSETNGWWSDIDIFIFLHKITTTDNPHNPPKTEDFNLDLQIDLGIKLGDILKTDRVQVSILNELPLMVQFEVLKDYEPLFIRDPEVFFEFKETTSKLAIDFSLWQKKWLDESLSINQK